MDRGIEGNTVLHSSVASGNDKEYDSMMYGCKIMVSLTLCRFLDHPVDLAHLSVCFSCTHDFLP